MDIEAEIRALQLDSAAEDNNGVVNPEEAKPEDVEMADKVEEEGAKSHSVQAESKDAGKSTTGGQILFLSGQVDDRTIQKYEKEAKDKSRESWYMAYIMDTNEEERVKGHKSYVPNMISGAAQADIGVLVISARKGEFETGYERGGQTREHVQLAKTLGVAKTTCSS
ncbi:hypothetical protein COLO4_05856 [Corchorus olitorius]|uniref:Tr-type G domain-containing protein n=1 Tax=Corchorus olitorius TaxID=93759 RepID=A0A1R3KPP4_9ROSI|nr:hypothetical protein COLO4_05856 [Corchorus olitorius]